MARQGLCNYFTHFFPLLSLNDCSIQVTDANHANLVHLGECITIFICGRDTWQLDDYDFFWRVEINQNGKEIYNERHLSWLMEGLKR